MVKLFNFIHAVILTIIRFWIAEASFSFILSGDVVITLWRFGPFCNHNITGKLYSNETLRASETKSKFAYNPGTSLL